MVQLWNLSNARIHFLLIAFSYLPSQTIWPSLQVCTPQPSFIMDRVKPDTYKVGSLVLLVDMNVALAADTTIKHHPSKESISVVNL